MTENPKVYHSYFLGVCIARSSCNQQVVGRELRYGRALAIIQSEEYLDAVSIVNFKISKTQRTRKTGILITLIII